MASSLLVLRTDTNYQQFSDKLNKALNMEEILDEAAAIILNRIRTRFLAERDPDNNPWIPSAAGLKRRAKGGTGTLFDTGRLFHSIQLADATIGRRVIATDVPYASKHQLGIHEIARPFLGINDEDVALVAASIRRRLKDIE